MKDTQKELTVDEFIKWLQQFPGETKVKVGVQEQSGGYESYGPVKFVTPVLHDITQDFSSDCGDGWEYNDWEKNQFSDSKEKTLDLGEAC
jgi:hypothetical protein